MKRLICSVRGCKNNSHKNKELTFFSVPKIPELRRQWIRFAESSIFYKKILVCSDHFSSEYLWEKEGKLLISSSAVPTLCPPSALEQHLESNAVYKSHKNRKKQKTEDRKNKPKQVEQSTEAPENTLGPISEQILFPVIPAPVIPAPPTPVIPAPPAPVISGPPTPVVPSPLSQASTITGINHSPFFIDSQGSFTANDTTIGTPKIEPWSQKGMDFQSDYVTENHINGYTPFATDQSWTNPVSNNVSGHIFVNPETQVNNDDQRSVVSNANSSDNNTMPVSQAAEDFFQDIEKEMKLKIPPYLKNALIYTGYDNTASLKNLDDTDFEEMQNFVRNQFAELFSGRQMLLEEYFGIFSHNIKQFQILPGHKKLLLAISKFLSRGNGDLPNVRRDRHIIKIE